MRIIAVAAVVALLQAASGAVKGTSADPTDPKLVRIDAIAVDGQGRHVRDLSPSDFEIVEDGVLRPVQAVQFVGFDGASTTATDLKSIVTQNDEQAEASRDSARLFAIFLDEYHISPGPGVARLRAALMAFVDREIGPRDLLVIVKPLDSLPNLRLTRDRPAIREAIATLNGRKGDYKPQSIFEEEFVPAGPPRVDQVRAQIVISSLNAIAVHLGGLRSGRKTIVVVSEGVGRIGQRRRTDPVGLPSLDTVIRSANRSGASIYPIVPAALTGDVPGTQDDASAVEEVDALKNLAQATDGRAILSASDVESGLAGLVQDSNGYYVIAFQPGSQKETGRFHPVTVSVSRPGVTLRARAGYWEPIPDTAAALRSLEPALPPMARRVSPLIRPWFGFAYADGNMTRVQFVWEPAPRVAGERTRTADPARVRINALNTDGTLAFEGVVGTAAAPGIGTQSDPQVATFDAAPGRLLLRMQIEDAAGALIDTDVRDLMVGRVAGPLVFGSVSVHRARSARELRAVAADPAAVPVTTRQFSRTETLLVRIPVHSTSGTPNVTVKLVPVRGDAVRELTVTAVPDSPVYQVEVPLAGLAPTDYRLQFFATTGETIARDTLTFRVTQ